MKSPSIVWEDSAPSLCPLKDHEVHVWAFSLDLPPEVLEECKTVLSQEELTRASGFFFEKDRSQFIAARAILRHCLGFYLNQNAKEIRIKSDSFGKPVLRGEPGSNFFFNLSHSKGWALFAFGREVPVGVDLEKIREDVSSLEIAERYFSEFEKNWIRSLPSSEKTEAFYVLWTAKEALAKGIGEGLQTSLHDTELTWIPGESKIGGRAFEEGGRFAGWSLLKLPDPAAHFAAALAVKGDRFILRCFRGDLKSVI